MLQIKQTTLPIINTCQNYIQMSVKFYYSSGCLQEKNKKKRHCKINRYYVYNRSMNILCSRIPE